MSAQGGGRLCVTRKDNAGVAIFDAATGAKLMDITVRRKGSGTRLYIFCDPAKLRVVRTEALATLAPGGILPPAN